MELVDLINGAQKGDVAAFTALTRRYQNMAFGYAFSLLQDFHLAEDATQEAFIAAWCDLPKLQEPQAFAGWLRGIVRHQCHRILRKRRLETVPLEWVAEAPDGNSGPDQQLEAKEMRNAVLAAIHSLPQSEREVTTLYYIQEYSHKEIAEFLGIPVTTVNNRLHASRTKLKRRLTMVEDTLKSNSLPPHFAETIGQILQIRGSVIKAQFQPETLPDVLSELVITDSSFRVSVEAVRRLDTGTVLCIATSPIQGLKPGMEVSISGGTPRSVSHEAIERAVQFLDGRSKAKAGRLELLETGIKPIDLLCPCAIGGSLGIFGLNGCGALVLTAEMAHRFADRQGALSIFKFQRPEDADSIREFRAEDPELRDVISRSLVESFYLLSNHAADAQFAATTGLFDTTIYCSKEIGREGIWPAIDPLVSHSRLLDPAIVGDRHYRVARAVIELLQQSEPIKNRKAAGTALANAEEVILARRERVRLFLSNPFFVAEPFTKIPARWVSLQDTIQSVAEILEGRHDHLPLAAFQFAGTIQDVVEKARALEG